MKLLWSLAKIKLWTDNLKWVNLENNILIKTDWNLIIKVWENTRNLSLAWSEYSLTSAINPKYEQKIDEINNQAIQTLKPLNQKINNLSWVLIILQQA